MKKLLLAFAATGLSLLSFAQTDSIPAKTNDTIRVGGMIIIKKGDGNKSTEVEIFNRKKNKPSNLVTNWWIFDLGFANLIDNTNYSSPEAQAFAPGLNKDQMDLKGKSINVNIWIFMQRMNLIKQAVNLKYGLGLELNNYHFDDERIRLQKNPTQILLDPELVSAKKNKLAADYITVPMMLNFNFSPGRRNGFGFSGGISAGYLYSARQKIKDDGKKTKLKDDFDLQRWKLSYIGELNLGPVKLYGSYAMKSMWRKGLDQTPYNVGIRFSSW
ncbi:MAG: outer membrane beta-barrel protein [Flavisolibacter sp.]|jgi:hypothetical protein|nr:outer membrane beta-barrel protein [Flavisolibacter sp.]